MEVSLATVFPVAKKKITRFLLSEEGKITKQSILSLGPYVSAAVIAGGLATKSAAATHTNSLSVSYSSASRMATGFHAHHESGSGASGSGADGTSGTSGSACGSACAAACSACSW